MITRILVLTKDIKLRKKKGKEVRKVSRELGLKYVWQVVYVSLQIFK